MYARSSTNTPAPTRRRPEQLDTSVTWINDWYIPDTFNVLDGKSIPFNLKLKGWYKIDSDHSHNKFSKLNRDDALDLSKWKYYNEVPILDHTASHLKEDNEDNEESKSELGSVITLDKDEEQISGLGGVETT